MTHYTHIKDLPLYNWRECQEGNLEFTRKGDEGDALTDSQAWDEIYNSFLQKFDQGRKFRQYYEKQDQLTEAYAEYAKTGDRFLMNDINVLRDELESLKRNDNPYTFEDSVADVSKWMGSVIDETKTTVLQFYTLHKRMRDQIEKQNKNQPKK